MLASVAEQASLSLTWSETAEDRFSRDEAYMKQYCIVSPKIICKKEHQLLTSGTAIWRFYDIHFSSLHVHNVLVYKFTYMPYLTLWDKISQNFAHLETNSLKIFQISQNYRPSYNTFYEEIHVNHILLCLSEASYI